MNYFIFIPLCLVIMMTSQPAIGQTPLERDCEKLAQDKREDHERLHALFRRHWEYSMAEYPELATAVGYPGHNDRWNDISLAAIERRKRELQAPLLVLKSIKRTGLNAADQLNYDLFRKNIEDALEGTRFQSEYLRISPIRGVQQDAARLLELSPHRNIKDYDDIIARLKALPELIDQTIALLKKGVELGITPPRITLRDVPEQVQSQLLEDPRQNPLLKSFADFPTVIPPAVRERLRQEAADTLKHNVRPAFRKLYEFLTKTYLPGARETIAMSAFPDGKAWYEYNVRTLTTTSLTPQQIHELGISEVKRIRGAMEKVILALEFKGSFGEFLEFLRRDSRFYYQDRDTLLMAYRDICKRADPELVKLFGKLPRLPYGVRPVPSYSEKSQPTAYYESGSLAAGQPAYFYANTYALNTRPKWEMEALSLHEAVPGHHLQIALAQEMEEAPEFRKHKGYTAYSEGWGLYAESLGDEMGFYRDPYMKFGQLAYEMWRAVRLVVDTGMHALGWSRRQAIDYLLANAGKNEHDAVVEVDRYIVWPGQALAYKIGQLKITELRASALKELGDRFDVRVFHDRILGQGALPLDILEEQIKEWLAAEARQTP